MREMSSQSINTNRRRSQFRGGETRIMKRALSSLLVFALVLTLLVPAFAFAADKTTEQKFNELKEKGLLNGVEDGSAALDRELTRAELAAILVRLFKLEPITGQSTFIDVPANHWAQKEGVIEAVAKAGLMGSTTTYSKTFSPDAKLTIAEVAKVAVSALGLTVDQNAKIDGVQPWAAPYVDAALKAGLIAQAKDYHANANRGILVDAAYVIYTTKINPVTGATKVESVKADNLKQVVVTFDGTVDQTSAEDTNNYSITGLNVGLAELQEDGKTVVLTLKDSAEDKFTNQKSVSLTVDGVKSTVNDKYVAKFTGTFTPVDVTIPSIKEVKALGTKAFQVQFSEPVQEATAKALSNYKVDGKSLIGTVDYNYPDTVFISTTLTTGDHKLSVANVKDFFDLKVNVIDLPFTVVEDTAAPEIVSAKSYDLNKVVVEFNEPVKSVAKAYHTSESKTGTIAIKGNKVTVTFSTNNKFGMNDTTIYLNGVEDYSGNKADRNITFKPELDREAPTVKDVVVDVDDNGNHVISVVFSEDVNKEDAEKGSNYTFKKSDGKALSGYGLNSKGNPIGNVHYVQSNTTAEITLNGKIPAGTYTLDVSGIRDVATIANTMVPYSYEFKVADKSAPKISSAWFERSEPYKSGTKSVFDYSFYVQFSKDMASEGNGSVVDKNKYNLTENATFDPTTGEISNTPTWSVLPTSAEVDMVAPDTVRISFTSEKDYEKASGLAFRVTLVTDTKGNWIGGSEYIGYSKKVIAKNQLAIHITAAKALDPTTIEVTFDGRLQTIDPSDFRVNGTSVQYSTHRNSGANTIVTFTLDEKYALPYDVKDKDGNAYQFGVVRDVTYTENAFGVKVAKEFKDIADLISPEYESFTVNKATYEVTVTFTEELSNLSDSAASRALVSVSVDGAEVEVSKAEVVKGKLVINLTAGSASGTLKGTNGKDVKVYANSTFEVSLSDANDKVALYTDIEGNPAAAFQVTENLNKVGKSN